LKIQIVNNCAAHYDLENSISKGDSFDFAAMHYQLEGQALNDKLNEAMHLQLSEPSDFYNHQQVVIQQAVLSIEKGTAPEFSYFKNPVTNVFPEKQTNLLEVYHLIKSNSFITVTDTLRNITDAKRAKEYKAAHFDYVTFSGSFSKRTDKALQKHSRLLTVDFDHIEDPQLLKEQLLRDEYFETELLFVSPSGDGLKWVIQIDLTKATHQDYFNSISNYLLHNYQVKIDRSGKDISRACFLPHDAGVYINPKYI